MAVYLVKTPNGERLIEARTPSAAINFTINKDDYSAQVLNPTELAAHIRQGLKLEGTPFASKEAA